MSEPIRKNQPQTNSNPTIITKLSCILCNKKIDNNNEVHKCLTRKSSQHVRVYLN